MYVGRVGIKGVVTVIGGGDAAVASGGESVLTAAKELGKELASLQSAHLLTDGGDGVRAAVCEGFYGVHPRSGIILGMVSQVKGVSAPNKYVEIPLCTPGDSEAAARETVNQVLAATTDVAIALPGDETTTAQLELLTKAKAKFSKPTIVYLPGATDTIGGKNAAALKRAKYTVATSVGEVIAFVKDALGSTGR